MKARRQMTAKYYILYNPHAGNGMSKAIAKSLKYEDSEIVAMTEIASYADFLADKQEATLIVCGGDGTLNRFINETDGIPHGDVYYMASGSGNDFLRDLGRAHGRVLGHGVQNRGIVPSVARLGLLAQAVIACKAVAQTAKARSFGSFVKTA